MATSVLEVIAAPYEVWLAPVGFAFPDVDEIPIGTMGWELLGTSGTKSYDEKGVTVTFNDAKATFTPAGSTAPRKVWRISEQISVGVDVVDMSAENVAKALNDGTVTQVAAGSGTPGTDSVPLLQGHDVALFAALIRGISSAGPEFTAQFELPIVYQDGKPAPAFLKGTPAGVAFNLMTLEDDDLGFGQYVIQTADAT